MNKIKLYVDDVLVYQQEGTVTPPVIPPIIPPVVPPPPPPSGGIYSQQVASAVKLNKPTVADSRCYGYYSGQGQGSGQFTIPQGGTVWFLIDPKGVVGTISNIKVQFTDFSQGDNLRIDNINSILIYTIDSSDNLYPLVINPQRIGLSGNTFGPWSPRGGHNDSKRYLIKATEGGTRNTPWNIYWAPQ